MMIGRIGFMSGLKIEDLAVFSFKGYAASKDIAPLEPTAMIEAQANM
jgi:hypothetical protein